MKKFLQYTGFWVLSLTWGLIITLIGFVAALGLLITGHKPKTKAGTIIFNVSVGWGLNLGPIIICEPRNATEEHEIGHAYQNILWGVLMPFVICIPSMVRFHYRNYQMSKGNYPTTGYYDIWFEGQASRWGEKLVDYYYKPKN